MKSYNVRIIELDDRDVRAGAVNGGLAVDLSPDTLRVIIRTMSPLEPEVDKDPLGGR